MSTHWSASMAPSIALMNEMSGLGTTWALMVHSTGVPVPSGKAAMNPVEAALAPNWLVVACNRAPSPEPCRSTTNGTG